MARRGLEGFTSISPVYLVPALALQTPQIAFAAAAWHRILQCAYPGVEISYLGVLACCATGVALNSVTPAHSGTLVTVLMLVAIALELRPPLPQGSALNRRRPRLRERG